MGRSKNKKVVLDLHGCKTTEVIDKVDRFLVRCADQGHSQVQIMTGKGTGAVQKVVIDYLKQARYPWKYEQSPQGKANHGVLVVFMD